MKNTITEHQSVSADESSDTEPIQLPVTAQGVERLLASHRIEGIGSAFANKLVERYGKDTISLLIDNPDRVADEISGLGEARAKKAHDCLEKIKKDLGLLLFLYSSGIGDIYIDRIISKYPKRAEERITDDPYSMVEVVWQLSFYIADRIGEMLHIPKNDPHRLQAALVSAVKYASEDGHLFATTEQAVLPAARMAGVTPEEVEAQIDNVVASGRLVKSRGVLYLPVFYNAEREGAEKISLMAAQKLSPVSDRDLPTHSQLGHLYSPAQREAIRIAMEHSVVVITGGPGSGKTTVVKGLIDMLEQDGKRVVLCAPTGRAAKRLETLTDHHATTIHSLLGYRQGEGYHNKKLDADVLIIDEGSMMEQVLFNHLLQAVAPSTRIIMVGDADQLPAIGAGDVLRDLIVSGCIPTVHLHENFRQSSGSLIASGARSINNGEFPRSDNERDLMIISEHGIKQIRDKILSLVGDELPATRGIGADEMLVVTPQQIGPLGARQLNFDLQERVNPDGPSLKRGSVTMRLGDPVMQTANSRERGVYNGEVGRITEVDIARQILEVTFSDQRKSVYARSELSELTLAYATTVHKLQGSEAKYIIIPVSMTHKPMLYRNLLYTAVSRATDLCILVGEDEAIRYAIDNTPSDTRNTNFKYRLQNV